MLNKVRKRSILIALACLEEKITHERIIAQIKHQRIPCQNYQKRNFLIGDRRLFPAAKKTKMVCHSLVRGSLWV